MIHTPFEYYVHVPDASKIYTHKSYDEETIYRQVDVILSKTRDFLIFFVPSKK
jgi:hypothetical protein